MEGTEGGKVRTTAYHSLHQITSVVVSGDFVYQLNGDRKHCRAAAAKETTRNEPMSSEISLG